MNSSHSTSVSMRAAVATASCMWARSSTLVTPIDEPSCGGLTISGSCSVSGTAATCASVRVSEVNTTERGVGRPSAIHTRLVITLSMPMALAITPEPV
jgi:hypothetical protein